ncbi:hypothetical protein [Flavobacterium sp.]|uniref:hypothetical protein n=1 Tax=Flavobacterium sp. TaxID=239 RepID=UPI002FD8AB62
MEPNNIENQIREKLSQREIQPSSKAWDRLDAMLSVEEQKPKRNFKWLAIAAVFLGFTVVGIFLLNSKDSFQNSVPSQPIVLENETNTINQDSEEVNGSSLLKPKENQVIVLQPSHKMEKPKSEINPKKDFLLEVKTESPVLVEKTEVPNTLPLDQIEKAQKLLAEVEQGIKTTDNSKKHASGISVNPKTLLESAEQEVTASFRNKLLQSIDKNYETIKSALANRNTE